MNRFYDITIEQHEFVVRFARTMFDQDDITRFLEYIELESIRKRSQLTQEQADTLANEIDRKGFDRFFEPTQAA